MEEPSSALKRKVVWLAHELEKARAALKARDQNLAEALEQQAATSNILQVISSSPADVQPVFAAIAENAARLFHAPFAAVYRFDGELVHFAAHYGLSREGIEEMHRTYPVPPGRGTTVARAMMSGSVEQVPDVHEDPEYGARRIADTIGARSVLAVPILQAGRPVGAIALTGSRPGPFPEGPIRLLRAFADQAVIAIENARLFEEVKARNHALTELLEQQTATSDVLNAISRSTFDLQPVLDTIVVTASRLCQAEYAVVWRLQDGKYHPAAANNAEAGFIKHASEHPLPPERGSLVGRTAVERKTVHIHDCLTDPEYTSFEYQAIGKYRTLLGVPLLRDGAVIGVICLMRNAMLPFTEKQIELVTTFADQAVIAIENARLFEEVQARNRELSETLEQQVATSCILRVIAESPTNIQPVVDAVTESAARLCDAYDATLYLRRAEVLAVAAHHGAIPIDFIELPLSRDVVTSRAVLDRASVHVDDLAQAGDEFLAGRTMAWRLGFRTILATPLLRKGEAVGALTIRRTEARPFSQKQIALLKTFADQAVIAIENVRLFEEVQTRTRDLSEALEQQTAASEILRVIARSPTDVQPVFDTIASSVARLCAARYCIVFGFDGDLVHFVAEHGLPPEAIAGNRKVYPMPPGRESAAARAILSRTVEQIPDVEADPDFAHAWITRRAEVRSLIAVPMLKDGVPAGAIVVARQQIGLFPERQINLLKSFADQAVIAIGNVRLFDEVQARNRALTESLERQTAMSDILRVISSSPTDLRPVFDTIAESAARLCSARLCTVFRFDGELIHFAAQHGLSPDAIDSQRRAFPMRPGRASGACRAILSGAVEQIPDVSADPDYQIGETAHAIGARSVLAVPMLRDGRPVGSINIGREELGGFPERQIDLLKTFADQAVIAIENVRLFDEVQARTAEVTEALQQQTATADVLKVISRSAFDLQAVLQALVESAVRLCSADIGAITMREGDSLRFKAGYGQSPELRAYELAHPHPLSRGTFQGRAAVERKTIHVPDVREDNKYERQDAAALGGFRASLAVPLRRGEEIIGVFGLAKRRAGPFAARQIELVETFADQAVIAIENVRLFEEVQAKSHDLEESLTFQQATNDVLEVIGRSASELDPVLTAIVDTASTLCRADMAVIRLLRDGALHHAAASSGMDSRVADYARAHDMLPIDRSSIGGRVTLEGRTIHVEDAAADPEYTFFQSLPGAPVRTILGVPLVREGEVVGAIILWRTAVDLFTERQIALVQTFADQGVIAIQNVRLFEEVQARTGELAEALQQQTATADVLKVISRSTFDLKLVLQTLVESAARLCDADITTITRQIDGVFYDAESYGLRPELMELVRTMPITPDRGSAAGRALLEGKIIEIADVRADPAYTFSPAIQKLAGFRTLLGVPMMREGVPIGVLTLGRREVRPFMEKQIELVQTFADQAVIAIENVRLFEEVQAKTRDLEESLTFQKATSGVLDVIGRSASDLHPVFDIILDTAADLCHADMSVLRLMREGTLQHVASSRRNDPAVVQHARENPILPADRSSVAGRVALAGHTIHIPDVAKDEEYTFLQTLDTPIGSVLGVPLVQDGKVAGVIALLRRVAQPFTQRQIELVETFAGQAVIAIANVGLFEEVKHRTEELSRSLEDLRSAQDRLVQTEKLASLGQLTAGIAHEIKNPLNFVNNFTALSTELIDELRDSLDAARLDEKTSKSITELTDMLKANLQKVVQHGKRADSIVKNMLLHSRAGSGERRPSDINGLVEEALNLAYHGARAERQDFNITLERTLDPAAGKVDIFPQEITRVLLNLISNGFYAATKRKAAAEAGYEPKLFASTKNLGHQVEIRIRDNGTGIPHNVKERMFDPFFTTKPAGEGTGLGLSLSHDIVVKQHAGTIEVETDPGSFTEFRIVLPRGAARLGSSGASS